MAEPFASVQDLRDRWPALPVDQETLALTLLKDASGKMRNFCRREGRDLDAALAAEELDGDTARRIACRMVKSALTSPTVVPEGTTQAQQSAGPFSLGLTFANPENNLYINKGEKLELMTGHGGKAFTIDTAPGGTRHAQICSLYFGAPYCSCGADLTLSGPLYEE